MSNRESAPGWAAPTGPAAPRVDQPAAPGPGAPRVDHSAPGGPIRPKGSRWAWASKRRGVPTWALIVGGLALLLFGQSIGTTETVTREVPAPAETVTETTTETVTEAADSGELDSAEARIEELEGENVDLEQQVAAAAAAPAPEPAPAAPAPEPAPPASSGAASTFSDGIYIVGTDVAPGVYRTPGEDFCSLVQYPDLSREIMSNMGAAQGGGPMIFEATTVGSVLESGGGCVWTAS